ncbi:putative protein kinase [Trypanosoma grayi]|uniref:putative protein kinase n=1 Tax=Trypanosoma grayi TaxID=71804 RepID=UPI0004F444D1|nr:putative protein kinase [Trypanosoma grayi]KEG11385.1 putative protein kinase [Trypanosoma grayi]
MPTECLGDQWLYDWGNSNNSRNNNNKKKKGDVGTEEAPHLITFSAATENRIPPLHHNLSSARSILESGPSRMWSLDDFEMGRKLGEGRFGKIYLARERRTKCAVVLKCLSKDMIHYHDLAHQLRREVELQEYAGRYHRHVLRLFAFFWDDVRVFLVLEYADGGNLQKLLDSRPQQRLSEDETRHVLRPLLSALAFMHDRDIIHRDVKPDNILFKANHVKLADFSWAVRLDRRDPRHSRRYTLCGTLDYLAPEQVSKRGCTTKADVWAVGVLTYRMLCGCLPLEHLSTWEICARIAKGDIEYPADISPEARYFMEALLCVDESTRFSCKEALQHPFLQGRGSSPFMASAEGVGCDETELPSAVSLNISGTPLCCDLNVAELPVHSPEPTVHVQHHHEHHLQHDRRPQHQHSEQQQHQNHHQRPIICGSSGASASSKRPAMGSGGGGGGGNTAAACSSPLSCVSFVTVSSSHSTDCIPSLYNASIPSLSPAHRAQWLPSSVASAAAAAAAATAVGVTSKSGYEDVGLSSQGASYSRPRLHCSTSDRSCTTMTQQYTQLGPSPTSSLVVISHMIDDDGNGQARPEEEWRDEREEDEEEAVNCVHRLCFDDSIVSLSQFTAVSATTEDLGGNATSRAATPSL